MTTKEISNEDLAIIQEHGVPLQLRPEFVVLGEGGAVQLTDRGRQLYRLACLLHGLSALPVDRVHNVEDLLAISMRVKNVRTMYAQDAAERVRLGRVPPKARGIVDAALRGTFEDLCSSVEHRLECEAAGPNVVPVIFRRSTK